MPALMQVLVLVHGSAVDVAWADASPRVGAILSAFYPGQMVRSCSCAPFPKAHHMLGVRLESLSQLRCAIKVPLKSLSVQNTHCSETCL